MEKVLQAIYEKAMHSFDFQICVDLRDYCREVLKTNHPLAIKYLSLLSDRIGKIIPTLSDVNRMQKFYDLHKSVLRNGAPHSFDLYLMFVEFMREPEKKFYIPRRTALLPIVQAMQDMADDKLDLLTISMPPGTGKLLADDTPIMTSRGWKQHGALRVGDSVVGADGQYKQVLHVFPKDVADYEVTFTNGETIKCNGRHKWVVYNRHNHREEIWETQAIAKGILETGTPGKRGHRYCFLLPQRKPMTGLAQDLPVDPYVLGAWLGDGSTTKPALTVCDTDHGILYEIMKIGKYRISRQYNQVGCRVVYFTGLREDLRKLGLCHSRKVIDKFIPDEYLRAPIKQRLRLLAGLLDTDGTLSRGNRYLFSNTNPRLIADVCSLLSTFGWRYSAKKTLPKVSSSGVAGRKSVWIVSFHPDLFIPCKVTRKKMTSVARRRRIAISSIAPVEPVPGNCIQVEGGLYLAGKTMLPTHNSTLGIFFLSWVMGKFPESQNLASAHSGLLTRSFFDGVLQIITDPEYLWADVFPGVELASTNTKEETIDLNKKHRFSTLTCRAINASLTGATRCDKILYADDLCSGIEEAMSKTRLDKLWVSYTNDLKSRKKEGAKEIHIATRWSVHDPIGRLELQYGSDPRSRFIVLPALNGQGESNFNYAYGVGFGAAYFEDMRTNLDEASFKALYMNEPIEREGLVYHADELRRYFELPVQEPDAIIGVCDTKDKGTDYAVLIVAYVYGQDYYIVDCVCDNGLPNIVDARLVEILLCHKVYSCRFESNSAGGRVAEKVQSEVKRKGGITHITTKFTVSNKETRIITTSAFAKEHFIFKDSTTYHKGSEYSRFMDFLCSYTMAGKNKWDDVPDAVSMLVQYIETFSAGKVEIIKRPW
jgi:predicted phage terminase large subunit-like protein